MSPSTWAASRTSAAKAWTVGFPGSARSCAASASASVRLTPPGSSQKCSTHVAPAFANADSTPAPMPRELPVTSTTLSGNSYRIIWDRGFVICD